MSTEKVKSEVAVPDKFKDLVKQVEDMSVLELSELVKVFAEKFGVSASAPVAMVAAPAANNETTAAAEKSFYKIELTSAGEQKIAVIKVVKEITGSGLKDAKDLVEKTPAVIKENVPKADAEEIKKKIEAAGGKVDLK